MKNTVFIIILTIVLACNNGPKERVMSTYGDGKPMIIVYEDPKTGEKLQEKTF
jgi:hypothetical protein